jgi:hypothetical protein
MCHNHNGNEGVTMRKKTKKDSKEKKIIELGKKAREDAASAHFASEASLSIDVDVPGPSNDIIGPIIHNNKTYLHNAYRG